MAKLTFRDILVKASSVYSSDMYLVENQFLYYGTESDKDSNGRFICRLCVPVVQICKETFPNAKVVFFSDVKKAKDDLSKYTTVLTGEKEKQILDIVHKDVERMNRIEAWKSFNFSEEDFNNLFQGVTIEILNEESKIPKTILNKSMIPLVTTKNISDLTYYASHIADDEVGKIYELTMSLVVELFELYMIYTFIPME